MASLFPILAVLILAIFVSFAVTPDEIIAAAKTAGSVVVDQSSIWDQTPLVEIVLGVRAILPLVLFLMFVLFVVLKSTLPNKMVTVYGLTLLLAYLLLLDSLSFSVLAQRLLNLH